MQSGAGPARWPGYSAVMALTYVLMPRMHMGRPYSPKESKPVISWKGGGTLASVAAKLARYEA